MFAINWLIIMYYGDPAAMCLSKLDFLQLLEFDNNVPLPCVCVCVVSFFLFFFFWTMKEPNQIIYSKVLVLHNSELLNLYVIMFFF